MALDGALIVQSDKTLLLDVDHERSAEARRAIAPFAELERAPEHIHTYRVTPLGLWNARAAGHDAEQVVDATGHDQAPWVAGEVVTQVVGGPAVGLDGDELPGGTNGIGERHRQQAHTAVEVEHALPRPHVGRLEHRRDEGVRSIAVDLPEAAGVDGHRALPRWRADDLGHLDRRGRRLLRHLDDDGVALPGRHGDVDRADALQLADRLGAGLAQGLIDVGDGDRAPVDLHDVVAAVPAQTDAALDHRKLHASAVAQPVGVVERLDDDLALDAREASQLLLDDGPQQPALGVGQLAGSVLAAFGLATENPADSPNTDGFDPAALSWSGLAERLLSVRGVARRRRSAREKPMSYTLMG